MALTGFPEYIKVRLGSLWNGGGNGLTAYSGSEVIADQYRHPANPNTFVLRRSGSGIWTEDGTGTGNKSTNRIRFTPNSSSGLTPRCTGRLQLPIAYTWFSTQQVGARFDGLDDYNFLDAWNIADKSSTLGGVFYRMNINTGVTGRAPSLNNGNPLSVTGTNGPVALAQYANVFSLMEETVEPRAPDKTAYRYG